MMEQPRKIFSGGIEAIGRSCILSKYHRVVFLEYASDPISAKSVAANLLSGTSVMLDDGGWYGRMKNRHYSTKTVPFPQGRIPQASDGWLHGYVMLNLFHGDVVSVPGKKYELDWYPNETFTRFGLLLPQEACQKEIEEAFFQRLSWFQRGVEGVKTPFHAEWTRWLWDEFERQEWIEPCVTIYGEWKAFIVKFRETTLQHRIEVELQEENLDLLQVFFSDAEEQQQYLDGEIQLITAPVEEEVVAVPEEQVETSDEAEVRAYLKETYGEVIAVVDDIDYADFEEMRLTPGTATFLEDEDDDRKWLLHLIATYQSFGTFRNEPFQVWTFRQNVLSEPKPNGEILPVSWNLGSQFMAEDGNGSCLFEKAFVRGTEPPGTLEVNAAVVPYGHKLADFVLPDVPELKLYADGNVIMLPEEY